MSRAPLALLAGLLLPLAAACSSDPDDRRTPPVSTGLDESFLDRRVDPCTDFYRFSCGRWLREHPTEPGYTRARYFDGYRRQQSYFELLLSGDVDTEVDLDDARAYRNACMAVREGKSSDFAPATALLGQVERASSAEDLAAVVAALHAAGVSALFHAVPYADPGAPSVRVVALWHGGWSLPTRDSYEDAGALAQPYRDHMKALADLFPRATVEPNGAWVVESGIATAGLPSEYFRDPVATYNLTEVSALEAQVPSFAWNAYFAARGFSALPHVNLLEPAFFSALETLLHDAPAADVRSYLTWRVLEATANAADRATLGEEDHFHGGIVLARQTPYSDGYACAEETRSVFGTALAHAYTDRFVAEGVLGAARDLVEDVRGALRADVARLRWLDDATREQIGTKLGAMTAKVGYPSDWYAETEISIATNDSFLADRIAVARASSGRASRDFSLPVDRSEWTMSPDTVNAIYSPLGNDITLPIAIFEEPYYSPDWPASSVYGAIGSLMGHEMSHGFDDYGRQFDGSGKLGNLWTDATTIEFQARAACLVDQYDAYTPLPGLHVNGSLSLGENIADLGGLKLAHAAFVGSGRTESPSPAFDAEQAFFVSYAQTECENQSDELLAGQLAADPHSPAEYRVNGVVRNLPEFAKAFSCPKNAELAPANRCEIW